MKRELNTFLSIALLATLAFTAIQADSGEVDLCKQEGSIVTKDAFATKVLWLMLNSIPLKSDIIGIEEVIATGADVNDIKIVIENDGSKRITTPLHAAAWRYSPGLISALIKAGAHVDATDENDATPLHIAASLDRANAVQELLEGGSNVLARNKWGDTPLHRAWSSTSAVKMLIAWRADVNAQNIFGQTPLHKAASFNEIETVKELIAHGADAEIRDHIGTPAEQAARHGYVEIVKYFASIGAASEELVAKAEAIAAGAQIQEPIIVSLAPVTGQEFVLIEA